MKSDIRNSGGIGVAKNSVSYEMQRCTGSSVYCDQACKTSYLLLAFIRVQTDSCRTEMLALTAKCCLFHLHFDNQLIRIEWKIYTRGNTIASFSMHYMFKEFASLNVSIHEWLP